MKTELSMSAEDLTSGRAQIIDDDDDDHDDHDDSDKINDAEGLDPERLKAFNVSHFCSRMKLKWMETTTQSCSSACQHRCYMYYYSVRILFSIASLHIESNPSHKKTV